MALTEIQSKSIKDGEIINADIANDTIAEEKLDISNTASDGQFLQYKDSSDKLTWANASSTPTTTRGDIIYRGASADARLAKGTAGQFLKIGANDPEWSDVSAGATGASTDKIFWENGQTVTTNYTIGDSFGAVCNAMSAGPITINNGVTVTIGTGETWTIV